MDTEKATRRKQPRTAFTRLRIVEAAANSISEIGFRQTSIQQVAWRAAVSQGAVFKHFTDKSALLAACVEHTLARFIVRFRDDLSLRLAGAGPEADRVSLAVKSLWRIFRSIEMHSVLEIYVAARTQVELGRALTPILDRHRENILAVAAELFPEAADVPDFPGVVDCVVYAMQGVILGIFTPDDANDAAHLAFFQRLAVRELEAAVARRLKAEP